MSQADNVGVVRMLWAAARENDIDALLSLTKPDVDWRPTAVAAPGLHVCCRPTSCSSGTFSPRGSDDRAAAV
jgi:hypothetical protein